MKKYEKPVAVFDKFVVLKDTVTGKERLQVRQDVLLREIVDEHILIPTGEAAESMQGIMSLNGSGFLLWKKLQSGCTELELVRTVFEEYEVSPEKAVEDVKLFLTQLKNQESSNY